MTNPQHENRTYNIYNVADVIAFVEELASHAQKEHVQKWVRTTFKSWLRRQRLFLNPVYPDTPLVRSILINTSSANKNVALSSHKSHASITPCLIWDKATPPPEPWAVEALNAGALYLFNVAAPRKQFAHYRHCVDWADANAKEPFSMTVKDVFERVRKHDEALKDQEQIAMRDEGTELVCQIDEDHYVVQLVTRESYKNEGDSMRHCVADYYGRPCRIYSLRSRKEVKALLTIEYIPGRLIQIGENCWYDQPDKLDTMEKAYRRDPTDEDLALLRKWLTHMNGEAGALDTWIARNKPSWRNSRPRVGINWTAPKKTMASERRKSMFERLFDPFREVQKELPGSPTYDADVIDDLENERGVTTFPLSSPWKAQDLKNVMLGTISGTMQSSMDSMLNLMREENPEYRQQLGRLFRSGVPITRNVPTVRRSPALTYRPGTFMTDMEAPISTGLYRRLLQSMGVGFTEDTLDSIFGQRTDEPAPEPTPQRPGIVGYSVGPVDENNAVTIRLLPPHPMEIVSCDMRITRGVPDPNENENESADDDNFGLNIDDDDGDL